jgi:hypothetical protein
VTVAESLDRVLVANCEVACDPTSSLAVDEDDNPLFDTVFYLMDLATATEAIIWDCTFIALLRAERRLAEPLEVLKVILEDWPVAPRPGKKHPLLFPVVNITGIACVF